MSKRSTAVLIGLIAVGAGALLWKRLAVDDIAVGAPGSSAETSFDALTAWGEPDLSGVWRGVALGAADGQDTFDLAALERLYTTEARAHMKSLSAADDPTLRCAPPAFPRAAMLGHPIQILQRPGFAFVLTEAYQSVRIIPTTDRPHRTSSSRS